MYLLVPTFIFDMREIEVEDSNFMQIGKNDMDLFVYFSSGCILYSFSAFYFPANTE